MKNIFLIFIGDLKRIRKNAIAWIVILGLSVVPSLYAWFNIAASWDPYSNTGSIKVAVANSDSGYSGDIIPIKINLGEQIISSLRGNDQLNWVFTSENKAVEGVKAGDYYAAIVIPKTFSDDLMSVFSDNIKHSDIIYYLNEKENAIAPKVTDKGADAIRKQIDELFTKTISEVGLGALDSISNMLEKDDSQKVIDKMNDNLSRLENTLKTASLTLKAFSNMAESTEQLIKTNYDIINTSTDKADENVSLLNDTSENIKSLKDALTGTTDNINTALSQTNEVYDSISSQLDTAFDSIYKDAQTGGESLRAISDEMQELINRYISVRDAVQAVKDNLPSSFTLLDIQLSELIDKMNRSISIQEDLRDSIKYSSNDATDAISSAKNNKQKIDSLISDNKNQINTVKDDYEQNVKGNLDLLIGTIDTTNESISDVIYGLSNSKTDIKNVNESASDDVLSLKQTLDSSAQLLDKATQNIQDIKTKLDDVKQSGGMDELKDMLGSGPEAMSVFLSSPVKLETKKLYPVENYGSAMAPFYTALSIWVGGIVLVAMIKVTLSEKTKSELKNLKNYQIYFGRYIIFLILGLIQTSIICLGDLYFLGIQCEYPLLFLVAGWISSIVYVNIIYTLTVSFGDVGKAVCVVLLVMQVAGSGGTFPVEVAPKFFQMVYPLLPFTHTMGVMREAVAGLYENAYIMEIKNILMFLIPSLLLGLVFRKPIIKLNEKFMEKLEETKIM